MDRFFNRYNEWLDKADSEGITNYDAICMVCVLAGGLFGFFLAPILFMLYRDGAIF
jgi:hypothetical protein